MTLSRRSPATLLLVLAVAGALRVYRIDQPLTDAFSWRQASTAMMAENFYLTNPNIFYPEVNWSGRGPNYQGREFQTVSWSAALVYRIVGQHDWVGRSISVAFGLLGIWSLYQLVTRVWDRRRALAAAAVMAVLPGSVFIERSFLPDPAMVALVTTTLWLWVEHLQTGRRWALVLAGVVGAWGFCTKLPGLIAGLPMAYAAIAILGWRTLLTRRWISKIAFFGTAVLTPVIAYYLWARHLSLSYPPYHFAGEGNWLWNHGLAAWIGQLYFLPRLSQRFLDWMWTAPVLLLVLLGLVIPVRNRGRANLQGPGDAPSLFHVWLAAGVVYYLIGAKELVDNPWNFHIVNPPAAALAGSGIVWLASVAERRFRPAAGRATAAVLLLVIVAAGYRGLRWMYHPYARNGHEMGLALRAASRPGDLVVTVADAVGDPVAIFYSGRRGWIFPPARPGTSWGRLPDREAESMALLDSLRAEGATWLGVVEGSQGRIRNGQPALAEHARLACQERVERGEWWICRLRPVRALPSEAPRPPGR